MRRGHHHVVRLPMFCLRPFCRNREPVLERLYEDTGKVRFVYQMPFIGPESFWAAEAAECAQTKAATLIIVTSCSNDCRAKIAGVSVLPI